MSGIPQIIIHLVSQSVKSISQLVENYVKQKSFKFQSNSRRVHCRIALKTSLGCAMPTQYCQATIPMNLRICLHIYTKNECTIFAFTKGNGCTLNVIHQVALVGIQSKTIRLYSKKKNNQLTFSQMLHNYACYRTICATKLFKSKDYIKHRRTVLVLLYICGVLAFACNSNRKNKAVLAVKNEPINYGVLNHLFCE